MQAVRNRLAHHLLHPRAELVGVGEEGTSGAR